MAGVSGCSVALVLLWDDGLGSLVAQFLLYMEFFKY